MGAIKKNKSKLGGFWEDSGKLQTSSQYSEEQGLFLEGFLTRAWTIIFGSDSVCLSANQICGLPGWEPFIREKVQHKLFFFFTLLLRTGQSICINFSKSQLLSCIMEHSLPQTLKLVFFSQRACGGQTESCRQWLR